MTLFCLAGPDLHSAQKRKSCPGANTPQGRLRGLAIQNLLAVPLNLPITCQNCEQSIHVIKIDCNPYQNNGNARYSPNPRQPGIN